jgi:hypothetical protein
MREVYSPIPPDPPAVKYIVTGYWKGGFPRGTAAYQGEVQNLTITGSSWALQDTAQSAHIANETAEQTMGAVYTQRRTAA